MKKGDLVRVKADKFDSWNRPQGFRSTTEEERDRWRQELSSDIDAGLLSGTTLQENLSLRRSLTISISPSETHT